MKSQTFFVIPREEEKYKKVFEKGRIWHNRLWLKRHDFGTVFKHYQSLIEEQKTKYKEALQTNKDFLKVLFEELKEAIDGVGKKEGLERELRSKLVEKLLEIKRLKEKLKKTQKKPAETKKPEEKKKPKEEIDDKKNNKRETGKIWKTRRWFTKKEERIRGRINWKISRN